MLNIVFVALMIVIFGRLAIFAFKMTWGILKIILTLICLPLIIIFTFIKGLFVVAWPLLLVVGFVSLIKTIKEA